MIIDGKDRYEDLNRRTIERVVSEAIGEEL